MSDLQNLNRSGAVCKFLSISLDQFYKLRDSGRFPAPYRIGATDMWLKSDILEWLESNNRSKLQNK